VIEETDTLIEYLLRDRVKVLGRLSGHVPAAGELVPEVICRVMNTVFEECEIEAFAGDEEGEVQRVVESLDLPIRRPRLCPGCPHRASFFAIRKANPKAIFTGDIGCYTLGINLGVVDTCLDMGASINMANGFYHAFEMDGTDQPIVATIGDSTFFHSGTAALINAVYNDSRFILVIVDNGTTAMTGMQPTPGLGVRADGSRGKSISLEKAVEGCGVEFTEVVDPYDLKEMSSALKRGKDQVNAPEGGIAVIIARHPCVIDNRKDAIPQQRKVTITDECTECNFCIERFECPALVKDEEQGRTAIDRQVCTDCGVCLQICPKGAIVEVQEKAQ
jgi:indolepyruvate ferredoxin oxidoreductase alpha subunit